MTRTTPPTVVVALGGNAIVRPGDDNRFEAQLEQTAETCRQLVPLIRDGHRVVITHGNGPQVGHSLRRVELAAGHAPTLPLDACVAETQGMIGFLIAVSLRNALFSAGVERPISTIVTTVVVNADDPALKNPTKPIGREYPPAEATNYRQNGWLLRKTPSGNFRRIVASPTPIEIVELPTVRRLVAAGEIVICCGGGGVPVVRDRAGNLVGIPAVIDKDLASGLLAHGIDANELLILSNVEKVQRHFGRPDAVPIDYLSPKDARVLLDAGEFPPGSMGPKIEAAVKFIDAAPHAKRRAILTANDRVGDALRGRAGTVISACSPGAATPAG
jgi:carbamate kinase